MGEKKTKSTRELPWIIFVKINFLDDWNGKRQSRTFPAQVMVHELFVRRVKSEPRRQHQIPTRHSLSPFLFLSSFLSLSLFFLCGYWNFRFSASGPESSEQFERNRKREVIYIQRERREGNCCIILFTHVRKQVPGRVVSNTWRRERIKCSFTMLTAASKGRCEKRTVSFDSRHVWLSLSIDLVLSLLPSQGNHF